MNVVSRQPTPLRPKLDASFQQDGGMHSLQLATTPQGDTVVFQEDAMVNRLRRVLNPQQAHDNGVHGVVASHVVRNMLNLPTLVYHRGTLQQEDGSQAVGNYSAYTTGFHPLRDGDVSGIKDPDTVVALQVAKAWVGDRDMIYNEANTWITQDGSGLGGDYEWALHRGTSIMGLPIGSPSILRQLGTPERIQPVVGRIQGFTDEAIRTNVDRVGRREIDDWTPQLSRSISKTLIANRDALAGTPFDFYQVHPHALRGRPNVQRHVVRLGNLLEGVQNAAASHAARLRPYPARIESWRPR